MVDGLNVLSLFDGISGGQLALQRAGVDYDTYYSSEIDQHAINVTQKNFPDTIQLGDVLDIDFSTLPKIDLLIGGSPCQSFSFAGDGSGFEGKSKLIYDYVRALNELKPKYFLLENVKMKKEWEDHITSLVGVPPIEIDSKYFSAQQRKRLYWTNIPQDPIEDKCPDVIADVMGLELKKPRVFKIIYEEIEFDVKVRKHEIDKFEFLDYIKPLRTKKNLVISEETGIKKSTVDYWFRSDRFFSFPKPDDWILLKKSLGITSDKFDKELTEFIIKPSSYDSSKRVYSAHGKHPTITTITSGSDRKNIKNGENFYNLEPEHLEKLQTLPVGYTKDLSYNQRQKAIGNGWTVDVIAHIFKNIGKEPKKKVKRKSIF